MFLVRNLTINFFANWGCGGVKIHFSRSKNLVHLTNNLQSISLVFADKTFLIGWIHQQITSPKTSLLSSLIMPFPVHWKRFSILWLRSSLLKVLFHLILDLKMTKACWWENCFVRFTGGIKSSRYLKDCRKIDSFVVMKKVKKKTLITVYVK